MGISNWISTTNKWVNVIKFSLVVAVLAGLGDRRLLPIHELGGGLRKS